MWEYTLTLPLSKLQYLTEIKEQLEADICSLNGSLAIAFDNDQAKLLLAVKESDKRQIKRKLLNLVSNLIIMHYKLDYLIKNFNFKINDDINMQAFLKALVVFDSDIDRQIIIKQLTAYDNIILESFFSFKLNILKAKWKDLINLANDNIIYLMSSDTFVELLKFLISNLDYRVGEVNVFYDKNLFFIKDAKGDIIEDTFAGKCTHCNDAYLITSLISLSPQKIKLHCDTNLKNQTINLLFNIFADRIIICNS